MRHISGGAEPPEFTEWRLGTPGVGYSNMPSQLRDLVKGSLIAEQRHLCSYTGVRIESDSSHIEHHMPQQHCDAAEKLAYSNLLACFPAPGVHAPFGAVAKGNWPSPAERDLFVSPRSPGCEERFSFSLSGAVAAARDADAAAAETIRRLRLDHVSLASRRKAAIDATLEVRGSGPASLGLPAAKRRLRQLEQAEAGRGPLEPFCFVLKQALARHIARLNVVRQSKSRRK